MPNPGEELSSINFSNMIGSPLRAVIAAQAEAALSTINFIKSVGFKAGTSGDPEAQNTGEPIYVGFKYNKLIPASGTTAEHNELMELSVPLLSIVPIPYIRVKEFSLAFHAKIDSMEYEKTDTSTSVSGNLQVQQRWPGGSAKLNVSASHQRSTSSGTNVQRSYALDIQVKAEQDDLPAGLEKVLNILERSVTEKPALTAAPA